MSDIWIYNICIYISYINYIYVWLLIHRLKSSNVQQRQWAVLVTTWMTFRVWIFIPLNYSNLSVYSIRIWIIRKECCYQNYEQNSRYRFKIINKHGFQHELQGFLFALLSTINIPSARYMLWKRLDFFFPAKAVCGFNSSSLKWETSISMQGHLVIKLHPALH